MGSLILVLALVLGASVGSFLNVCIFRLPRRCLGILKPKLSFCPGCHRTLASYENVPVLAYLALRGRCRSCRAPIPFRYFLVEVGTAALFALLASRQLVGGGHVGAFIVQAAFASGLIVCALVDWDHREIPDQIDVPGFLLAPVIAAIVPELWLERAPSLAGIAAESARLLDSALPWWGLSVPRTVELTGPLRAFARSPFLADPVHADHVDAVLASIIGLAAGGGLIWGIGWMGKRLLRQDAMGFGDVKFFAMIGGFTGWQGVLATIVVASVLGSVFGIARKTWTGRPTVTGKDLAEATLLSYLALRAFGAPAEAPDDKPIPLRFGAGLIARFGTGDPYIPFGPFLAVGAGIFALWPDAVAAAHMKFGELVYHAFD